MWSFTLAVLEAMVVLGKRRRSYCQVTTYLVICGDFLVAATTLGGVSAALGLAEYAAVEEDAEWPPSARYIAMVATSSVGITAIWASLLAGVVHAVTGKMD